jgi:adenosylhomocysteine nucleosidase
MAVAVLSAMAEEIELYLDTCTVDATRERAGLRLHEARHHGHDLVLVKAGVGKVNAALATQLLIDHYALDAVVCTGSAGALHDGLAIGDIVVATDCVQHDLHVEFLGLERGAIPFSDLRFFAAAEPLVRRARNVSLDGHAVRTGRVCTGDTFIQDEAARRQIREELGGDCVEMEGAAVGQVCTLNDVPFLLVRAISDRADGSSDVDFPSFLREAARSSAHIVLRLLAALDPESLRPRA